jgi:microcystin-dependent protein
MSQPYVGEIRMGGWNFAPVGWALCNGALLSIAENSTLFNLIGTTYGGNGQTTFALPNLLGRIPFHQGTGAGNTLVIGQVSGVETVTLTSSQLPAHTHSLAASSAAGTQPGPAGGVWAASTLDQFSTDAAAQSMAPSTITSTGSNQPHDNIPPFQAVTFIISLYGVYPSQN